MPGQIFSWCKYNSHLGRANNTLSSKSSLWVKVRIKIKQTEMIEVGTTNQAIIIALITIESKKLNMEDGSATLHAS